MSHSPHTFARLFVDNALKENNNIELNADQTHYLLHVRRIQPGDPLLLFNGSDGEWMAQVAEIPKSKKSGLILRVSEIRRPQPTEPDLWLCPAPIKKNYLDFMVMKATELGVSVIQPILTARSQIREINPERLRAIAIEAAEQSERLSVPLIKEPLPIDKLIRNWPNKRLPLLCAEFGEAQPIAQALGGALARARPAAAVLTGPEGGYTPEEMDLLRQLPEALPVRLGPRILRADTAAVAALTCWQALCGDWQNRDWPHRQENHDRQTV